MPQINPTTDNAFYDLVIVGRGYSASTYLFSADLSWCKKILIIGGPDAWQNVVRGDGIVNHANYIYARDNPENKIQPSPTPTARDSLKDENLAILNKAVSWLKNQNITVTEINGTVSAIDKQDYLLSAPLNRGPEISIGDKTQPAFSKPEGTAAPLYDITYTAWDQLPDNTWDNVQITGADQKVTALKLVYCGGAGPHKDFYNPGGEGYMDLDTFMRNKLITGEDKKVAVLGPNAGIDSAIEALDRKMTLYWLISGPQNSNPAWLSSKHYKAADMDEAQTITAAENRIVNYPKADRFKLTQQDSGYTFTFKNDVSTRGGEELNKSLNVDYVVYATGQDPAASEQVSAHNATTIEAKIGPAKVLSAILAKEKLTPIYDTNQRFGQYFETALGLQDNNRSHYTGLEVLGASAFALSTFRGGSQVTQAYFQAYGQNGRALDITVQNGQALEGALTAIQNATWNDRSVATRLYDYFDNFGSIPDVATSMSAILKKLYLQSLVTADQLGTIKNQIEAVTGFGLIAASTNREETTRTAQMLMQKVQAFGKSVEALQTAQQALAKSPADQKLRAAVDTAFENLQSTRQEYWDARRSLVIGLQTNIAAEAYIETMSQKEQSELRQEGVDAITFAATIEDRNSNLWNASVSPDNSKERPYQDGVLTAIPSLQKWLTNLLAVYQAPTVNTVQSAINFNSADKTQLAVLLAVQYPAIPVTDWPDITTLILEGRKLNPWGYSREQVQKIEGWLKDVNSGKKAVGEFPI